MSRLLGLLFNRWVMRFFLFGSVSFLIFTIGPLLSIGNVSPLSSVSARWIALLVFVIAWLAYGYWQVARAKRAGEGIAEGLASDARKAQPEPAPGAEEVEAVGQRFEEAIEALKKMPGKRGTRSLHDLPWYVMIGPPGSGKTTALVNSGLEFPLAERFGKDAIRGEGGTRNCDWLFTDNAILIDTAGRYLTQDSDVEADSTAWLGFLDLLKKYRRRRPINGIIVAISVEDLYRQSNAQRDTHIQSVEQRIREIYERLNIRLPIYLMLTKADLIAGFVEFFDDYTPREREQVWGVTFPFAEDAAEQDPLADLDLKFDQLVGQLNGRVLTRVSDERDIGKRSAIYAFPLRVEALRTAITEFIAPIFKQSRHKTPLMLRGIYLTSGAQSGNPFDRMSASLEKIFGLVPERPQAALQRKGKSFFITDLFEQVIFAEQELAGTNRRAERRRAWLQRTAYLGTAVASALIALAWFVSYGNNKSFIAEVSAGSDEATEIVEAVRAEANDVLALLPALNAVRHLPSGYEDQREGTPWLHGFGLYQGKKLGGRAVDAYESLLRNEFLPRLMVQLEDALDAGADTDAEHYEAFKAYMLLDSEKLDPDAGVFDKQRIESWKADIKSVVMGQWKRAYAVDSADQRVELGQHLDALIEQLPAELPRARDESLVRRVKDTLRRTLMEDRIYQQLGSLSFEDADGDDREPPAFTIVSAGGPYSRVIFDRRSSRRLEEGIRGLYTKAGYQQLFPRESSELTRKFVDEAWLLAEENVAQRDAGEIWKRVRDKYLDDYASYYEELLYDVELTTFSDAAQAASAIQKLSSKEESPLLLLLQGVRQETMLTSEHGGVWQSILGRLRLSEDNVDDAPADIVTRRFKELHELVDAPEGETPPINKVLEKLDLLADFLKIVDLTDRTGGDIPPEKFAQGQADIQDVVLSASDNPDILVQRIMLLAAKLTSSLGDRRVASNLNDEWSNVDNGFCKAAIEGRYPINKAASSFISMEDFGKFFGPGGIADRFYTKNLSRFIDTSGAAWRVRPGDSEKMNIQTSAMRSFERARAIRDAFFRNGGGEASVTFDMVPRTLDRSAEKFVLNLEGRQLEYSHGPQVKKTLTWPGPEPSRGVFLSMLQTGKSRPAIFRADGPWAWFELLESAGIRSLPQDRHFEVNFTVDGTSASYELIASSVFHPFELDELERFRCARRITR